MTIFRSPAAPPPVDCVGGAPARGRAALLARPAGGEEEGRNACAAAAADHRELPRLDPRPPRGAGISGPASPDRDRLTFSLTLLSLGRVFRDWCESGSQPSERSSYGPAQERVMRTNSIEASLAIAAVALGGCGGGSSNGGSQKRTLIDGHRRHRGVQVRSTEPSVRLQRHRVNSDPGRAHRDRQRHRQLRQRNPSSGSRRRP